MHLTWDSNIISQSHTAAYLHLSLHTYLSSRSRDWCEELCKSERKLHKCSVSWAEWPLLQANEWSIHRNVRWSFKTHKYQVNGWAAKQGKIKFLAYFKSKENFTYFVFVCRLYSQIQWNLNSIIILLSQHILCYLYSWKQPCALNFQRFSTVSPVHERIHHQYYSWPMCFLNFLIKTMKWNNMTKSLCSHTFN